MKLAFATAFGALVLVSQPVLAEGVVRAGSTPAGQPASGLDAGGKWEGVAVELLTEMLSSRGMKVEFTPMNFADLQGALTSSKIDVIAASFGVTPERQRVVDFTEPYGSYRDVLLVPDADKTSYKSLADMKGKRIATSRGSAFVQPLLDAGVHVVQVANPVEGFAELTSGKVDGLVDNGLQMRFRARQMNLTGFRIVDSYAPIAEGKLAFAVRKEDKTLLPMLNEALREAERNGSVGKLKAKWSID